MRTGKARLALGVLYVGAHIGAAGSHAAAEANSSPSLAPYTLAQPEHRYRITEDSPLWDCSTMGNRQCGPARTFECVDDVGCELVTSTGTTIDTQVGTAIAVTDTTVTIGGRIFHCDAVPADSPAFDYCADPNFQG